MSKIMRQLQAEASAARDGLKRYSSLQGDSGYANWLAIGRRVDVRVDGSLINGVFIADEVAGFVEAYEVPMRLTASGDELVTYTLHGEVRVTARD